MNYTDQRLKGVIEMIDNNYKSLSMDKKLLLVQTIENKLYSFMKKDVEIKDLIDLPF